MNVYAPPTRTGARIAVVTSYPPSRATLNEYGFHLVEALKKDPRVARVYVLADRNDDAKFDPRPDVSRCWTFGSATNGPHVRRELRRLAPDGVIINAHFRSFAEGSVASALNLLTAPWLTLSGTRTVLIMHNIIEAVDLLSTNMTSSRLGATLAHAAGTVLTKVLLQTDRVSVLLPRYREMLQNKYGANNVVHIPHGVFGETPVAPYPTPDDGKSRLLAFGKFGTYKRVEILLEAAEVLEQRGHRNLEVVIAGTDSPNTPGYLESVKERFRGMSNVRFTGYVPEEEVVPTLGSATVVVLPYTSTTGSSGVLHQVGSVGRAVAMPRIGDLAELMTSEGYDGEVFTPGSSKSLADALERLITDRERRESVERANFTAAQACSMSHVAARYVDEILGISADPLHEPVSRIAAE